MSDLVTKAFSQRGPMSGNGRGPGRPWRGIVEDTPALWISWIKDMCRRLELDPEALGLELYGEPITITGVELNFGRRHYFRCPACTERREALFFVKDLRSKAHRNESGGRALCRECARLGYRSQCHRPGSALGQLDRIMGRGTKWPRMHGSSFPTARDKETLLAAFREGLEAHVQKQIDKIAGAIAFDAEIERLRPGR